MPSCPRSPTSRRPSTGWPAGEEDDVTSIQMPQLGETIVEGTILKWLKREGDSVDRDEPLFEISTDKVDTEVPSPVAGTVRKILVEEGTTVPVGTALMEIDEAGAAASGVASGDAASSPDPSAAEPAEAAPEPSATPAPSEGSSATPPAAAPSTSVAPAAAAMATVPDRGPRSQILSPLVRRLAKEHDLDLAQIPGTGSGGRITKADVTAVISSGGARATGGAAAPTIAPAQPMPAPSAGIGDEVVPVSHIRRAIAEHMLASTQGTARAWTMVEVNVDHLVKLRERVKDAFQERYGIKITYLPMVVRATVDALLEYADV